LGLVLLGIKGRSNNSPMENSKHLSCSWGCGTSIQQFLNFALYVFSNFEVNKVNIEMKFLIPYK